MCACAYVCVERSEQCKEENVVYKLEEEQNPGVSISRIYRCWRDRSERLCSRGGGDDDDDSGGRCQTCQTTNVFD